MQKKQVCVLFCISLLFLKLFFFCHDGNGPGRAGPDLPGTATGRAGPELNGPGRAEKNGPVQASNK